MADHSAPHDLEEQGGPSAMDSGKDDGGKATAAEASAEASSEAAGAGREISADSGMGSGAEDESPAAKRRLRESDRAKRLARFEKMGRVSQRKPPWAPSALWRRAGLPPPLRRAGLPRACACPTAFLLQSGPPAAHAALPAPCPTCAAQGATESPELRTASATPEAAAVSISCS